MKVLVVNDENGHCNVFEFTVENMKQAIRHLLKIRFSEVETNAFRLANKQEAEAVLVNDEITPEELAKFLSRWEESPIGRSCGGLMYLETVEANWLSSFKPWS